MNRKSALSAGLVVCVSLLGLIARPSGASLLAQGATPAATSSATSSASSTGSAKILVLGTDPTMRGLVLMDPDASNIIRVVPNPVGKTIVAARLSPDGRLIAYAVADAKQAVQIFVVGVNGKSPRQITKL